ncbi:arsenate reductase family protein [Viscerimonas tarda]
MENLTFICYSKCSACRKAAAWLKENGINVVSRPIVENNPTKEELTAWKEWSKLPPKKFFNTSGNLYKELHLKDKINTASAEELIALLASNGMLVKRPIVAGDHFVVIGFNEEEWTKLFK